MDLSERVHRWLTKWVVRKMEWLPYEERQRQMGLLSLEKRRVWGDLMAAF